MKIAIMQPYFFPYAGYFRLISQTDLFVVYDCVQFPRRGFVHRCKYRNSQGNDVWLTLPLQKTTQNSKINKLSFRESVTKEWRKNLSSVIENKLPMNQSIIDSIDDFSVKPVDYLVRNIDLVCREVDIPFNWIRSSSLQISDKFKGADRIVEICKQLDANQYLNAPNGRELYSNDDFERQNISLEFLPKFEGNYDSTLIRLLNNETSILKKEICSLG